MSIFLRGKPQTFLFKKDWREEMTKAFKSLMKAENNYTKFYVHNLSNFDSYFMLDILASLGDLKFNKRDGKIISIKWTFKSANSGSTYTINFYDSLLILNSSLDSLSKSFKVETPKGKFPIFFVNGENFSFDYEGSVPELKYFHRSDKSKFTYKEYLLYCNMFNQN
jgi:hypothetical protein